MQDLQAWFAPLLWIMATITAIVAFVRLCKPVWRIFSAPKELDASVQKMQESMDSHFSDINAHLDKYDNDLHNIEKRMEKSDKVQMSLLHDQIVQIYDIAKLSGEISQNDYKRACDLYAQDGESEYIDGIMDLIRDMYLESERQRNKVSE